MIDCKPADTMIVSNHGLRILNGEPIDDQRRYQSLVGRLIYLSHTQPDIGYVMGIVSQLMHHPRKIYMEVVFVF